MSVRTGTAPEDVTNMSRYRIGQWVGFSTIARDRDIIGKVIALEPVTVETRDNCQPGQTRRVTFYADAPWFPSPIRWRKLPNGRRGWEYAR